MAGLHSGSKKYSPARSKKRPVIPLLSISVSIGSLRLPGHDPQRPYLGERTPNPQSALRTIGYQQRTIVSWRSQMCIPAWLLFLIPLLPCHVASLPPGLSTKSNVTQPATKTTPGPTRVDLSCLVKL